MSEALFRGLPRFDDDMSPAEPDVAKNWQKSLEDEAPVVGDAFVDDAASFEMQEPVQSAEQIDLTLVEQSLGALAGQLEKIEQQASAQTQQAIQSIAAKLFPALSEQFLADEISQHLGAMVPASAAVIAIRAQASLADALRTRIEGIPALVHRCTVTTVDQAGSGRVDVSWQSGGLSFDFDGLLAACLSHLNSSSRNQIHVPT